MQVRAALLLKTQQPFHIEQLELEEPHQHEVRVRIRASGVCHSDYHLQSGSTKHPLPLVPGHEGAGVVEAVGPGVSRVKPGDHVVLSWAPACRQCFYCRKGSPNLCDTFVKPLWAGVMPEGTPRFAYQGRPVFQYCGLGSFAERTVVREESCIPIARDVPLDIAALVGCAVSTGVGAALRTARVEAGASAVVLGCGGVGLNIVQGLRMAGATTILAVDKLGSKEDLARKLGATDFLQAGDHLLEAIRERTGGRGADYAFEAVGTPALQRLAFDACRPGGTAVLAGLAPMGSASDLPGSRITREEKTVMGSYYGSVDAERDFPWLLDRYREGVLELDSLISGRFALGQINEAYAAMLTGTVARSLVVFAADPS